jgi:UDP-N-acetyl-D-mannosaminuronic acid dehydrogenase
MKICIIGQGYIGLPTSLLFADKGCNVLGVDVNQDVVNKINKGTIHIEEPGLEKKLKNSLKNGTYIASTKIESSNVFIITVPTPVIEKDLNCDLSYVISACESILPFIKENNLIIIESTIAPMSTNKFIKPIFENEGYTIGKDLYLAHCPERVLPGRIIEELVHNDRIIGGITSKCADKAENVYKIFVKGEIIKTEAKTAEMSKCMENTFRDVNIALANELTKICSKIGVNALDAIEVANKHPRVNIHSPGPGVGGHCLAIDPYFIYSQAPETAKMIKLARDINNQMPVFVVEKTKEILKDIKNPKIAILGIAYKGNTDDTRESPAIEIINLLKKEGFEIAIHDPHIKSSNKEHYMLLLQSFEIAITNANLCLILTDHDEFRYLDYDLMSKMMETPLIFDTKNVIKTDNDSMEIINYGNLVIS